ncbi:HNH endonuclease family protein, partial [Desulfosarcina sp. OttesenSCG-928-G10]|nr:HNH endonuclease family protein [Desulfosarcina sp. OttesenSCG-928-G10]
MTLLETGRNREIGNADYDEKRHMYGHRVFQITRAISEHYDSWNRQETEARQIQLAK